MSISGNNGLLVYSSTMTVASQLTVYSAQAKYVKVWSCRAARQEVLLRQRNWVSNRGWRAFWKT